jgi:hypothetical protein
MYKRPYDITGLTMFTFFMTVLFIMPSFSFANTTVRSSVVIVDGHVSPPGEEPTQFQLAAAELSVGMTKTEVYEIKGTPDKVKRPSVEESREVWVYRCMNSDGFNEDCLYLFFEDDRLVKIDNL